MRGKEEKVEERGDEKEEEREGERGEGEGEEEKGRIERERERGKPSEVRKGRRETKGGGRGEGEEGNALLVLRKSSAFNPHTKNSYYYPLLCAHTCHPISPHSAVDASSPL